MSCLRRRFELSARGLTMSIVVLMLLAQGRLAATNDETHIAEIMAGANGNSKIQFIVVRQEGSGNLWGPQGGETQSRAMLVFFDATGRETGSFKFPTDAPANSPSFSADVLIATPAFKALLGAPTPNFIMPPLLNPISGAVCFKNNPSNNFFSRKDCVSYGGFAGFTTGNSRNPSGPGAPAPALPITNTVSLRNSLAFGTDSNADFVLTTTPTPRNNGVTGTGVGPVFTIPGATQIAQGETLFTNEPFLGNGRTCAACHVSSESFRLPPSNIKSRFGTLGSTFDPLFIAETKPSSFDAGFDFNLNTITVSNTLTVGPFFDSATGLPAGTVLPVPSSSNAPCTGELREKLASGLAKVLTRISPTSYLIFGGKTLAGTVTDDGSTGSPCSATVSSVTSGGLNALEDPKRMRGVSADAVNFPDGRGLILENIDGLPPTAPVFRKSPHLLNLFNTGPFGFSSQILTLQEFATGAVKQHFPRKLARNAVGTNADPDFRLPTPAELDAMAAFMLDQDFPKGSGSDPSKSNLDLFATTAAQRRGREAFGGTAKCIQCHGGQVLARTTASVLGKAVDINAAFDTGVVRQLINGAAKDNLPSESGGTREFSVPQLFNVKNLGPFFHDASVKTLREAVEFYTTAAFTGSPASASPGGVGVLIVPVDDITAFLEGLVVRPYTLTFNSAPVTAATIAAFGNRDVPAGPTAVQNFTITNTSSSPISFSNPACTLTGTNPTEFVLTPCLTTDLAPGVPRIIQVAFDPSTIGAKSAILEINAKDPADPSAASSLPSGVALSGQGTLLPPTVTAIAPASGRTAGLTPVTITGTNFVAPLTLTIGGAVATVGTVTATTITATTGAHAAGLGNVVVTNPDTQTATLLNGYTYVDRVPTAIGPTSGKTTGGTSVTINGTNFQVGVAGTTVTIGGAAATSVVVVNATTITATTGARAAGLVDVVVTFPDGQTGTLTSAYTYIDRTITSILPTSGKTTGGTNVTINGTNFQVGVAGTTVTIGGAAATSVVVVDTTTITATTGAHAVGLGDVVVTFPDGQTGTLPGAYTYINRTLTAIAPTSGKTAGGTNVTITGTNFQVGVAGTTVTIGGVTATSVVVVNATTITATTGARAAGPGDVVVTNPDGQAGTLPGAYTYIDRTPTAIAPTSGKTAGGTNVTITGTNFQVGVAGTTVTIGGAAATSVVVVNATTITATTGAHAAGPGDVVVTFPDGQTGTLPGAYTYVDRTITSILPISGSDAGGTPVTITGTNFQVGVAGTTVTIGGAAATVGTVTATTIAATTGAHAFGLVDVVVTFPDTQTSTLTSGYRYLLPTLTVTAIAPASGPTAGGAPVTITGTNFVAPATVTIGGVPATVFGTVTATTITATTGAHAGGVVDVVVTNPDTQVRTLANGYRYQAPFVVNSTLDAVDAAPGNGVCATAGGVCTLRAAVQEANALPGADVITLPAGIYMLTIAGTGEFLAATGDLNIFGDVTINGAGSATTIVDGNAIDRVFHLLGSTIALNDLTVRNGNPAGSFGGCISFSASNFTLARSVVTGCSNASSGAGIFGGGTVAFPSTLTITDTTISQNVATVTGGGLDLSGDGGGGLTATIRRSTISGNVAGTFGGGISATQGTITIANSTITGNSATTSSGGAINVVGAAGSVMTLANVTVAASSSATFGAVTVSGAGLFTARNTIVLQIAAVSGPTCAAFGGGTITNLGNNLEFPGATCGFTTANPLLVALASNGGFTQTHALGSGSPAIDAGDAATCAAAPVSGVDQRGTARPSGANCDIGAFEFVAPPPPPPPPPPSSAPTPTPTPTPAPTPVPPVVEPPVVPPVIVPPPALQPTVTAIAPASGTFVGGTSVTITGANFVAGATVSIGGVAATVGTVTATTITATTGKHDAGGPFSVVVTNPDTQTGTLTNGFIYTTGDPPPPAVPLAPTNLTSSVSGSTVTLYWNAASSGPKAGTYVVEAGSFTGAKDLAVFSTGNTSTSITAENVGTGIYFVRIRAQNDAGQSAPSNEVVVTVGDRRDQPPNVPGPPSGFVASVNGSTVALAWNAPTPAQGGSPSAYQIEAGSFAGLSDLANFSTGSTATSFSGSNVPAGTYFVRVRAVNAAGTSSPSNEVGVVVGGPPPPDKPSPPSGLVFTVSGSTVTLGWNASIGATSYILEAGSSPGRSDIVVSDTGNTARVLVATNVGRGTYFVRVSGRNASGTSASSNEVAIVVQ